MGARREIPSVGRILLLGARALVITWCGQLFPPTRRCIRLRPTLVNRRDGKHLILQFFLFNGFIKLIPQIDFGYLLDVLLVFR